MTVDGFPNTIFDPSYGNMVPGTSLLAAEQQYEDLYVPDVVNPNGTWQPDPPGARIICRLTSEQREVRLMTRLMGIF